MKRILCYGDSNTWGFTPGSGKRYPSDVRWTGVMAKELGEEYEVVEAGLNGRTTVYTDPFNDMLNGLEYLPMVLVQSKPLDLIIISLGTNDLKFVSALHSARGVGKLIETCKKANDAIPGSTPIFNEGAKILVVSPIEVDPQVYEVNPYTSILRGAVEESKQFPEMVKHFTDAHGVAYFNAASVAVPSKVDGIHMEPESHVALGKALAEKVREII